MILFVVKIAIGVAMLVWLQRCGLSNAGLWVAGLFNLMGYVEGKLSA